MSRSPDLDRDDLSSGSIDDDERQGLYIDEGKPANSSRGHHRSRSVSHNFQWLFRRLPNLRGAQRRTIVIGAIIAIVSLAIVVELVHVNSYRGTPPPTPPPTEVVEEAKPPPIDHNKQCTTWPVDESGNYNSTVDYSKYDLKLDTIAPQGGWKKPAGVNVVGLIFFGRRRTVDLLDCYLQQNLASNGGYLDKVLFLLHTRDETDRAFLKDLLAKRPDYEMVNPGECDGQDFSCMWDMFTEDDTIYIKIDDDIAFIHHDAIPQIVHTRLAEPHPLAISANLVNSPLTGTFHTLFGAMWPFLPDYSMKPSFKAAETWRPSEKPYYPANKNANFKEQDLVDLHAPYDGHTWLQVSDDHSFDIQKTPMGMSWNNDAGGETHHFTTAWRSWAVAAQQHYALFRNLELNRVSQYFFGRKIHWKATEENLKVLGSHVQTDPKLPGGEQLYDTQYKRYNLNFIAIWGHDVKAIVPLSTDDEQDITVTRPRELHRPFVIDTRVIVAHLSFYTQHNGIKTTDILDRWRAFANEMVCTPQNRKTPFDERCPGF
ncbi:uncharacterized protein B0I36DRAFT_386277 [Microdochium trichocladiopsis]|uniref:Uncharacterized protein n=1 Tax=Microdochium trichocladiopsis TaxID=1682393 RepID=A0A9P9BQI2_9PEZI|nr:uncharacterized protein B0I36DRAFT_386277 [Microdochium trichocladiopsis]KAH7025902.1 hypothetical protein B0I36DRAFT_386277 [Microdochium trichocladiopsis]